MHPARRIGKWGACFQGRYCCRCSSVSEERLLLSASAWTAAWPYLCAARRSWLFAFWKLASDATRRVKDSLRRRARLTWSQTSRWLSPQSPPLFLLGRRCFDFFSSFLLGSVRGVGGGRGITLTPSLTSYIPQSSLLAEAPRFGRPTLPALAARATGRTNYAGNAG